MKITTLGALGVLLTVLWCSCSERQPVGGLTTYHFHVIQKADSFYATIGFAISERTGDAFCSVAVYSRYVNFGFNRGPEIEDREKKLAGSGSLYRRIAVSEKDQCPRVYIKKLLKQAHKNSVKRMKDKKQIAKGITITKSTSSVKRMPRHRAGR